MTKHKYTAKTGLLFCLVFLGLFLHGCRLGYIIHAGTGQFKLLYHSVEIEKALNSGILTADQKERLLLVDRIKAFGESELGLEKTGSYRKVYLESRHPPIYLLSASPKDRLQKKTWYFPVVGDMPYLGFFDLEKARAEEERLNRQDMDVFIGRADAYSTLGWFNDPVTMNLLHGSTNALVETILHEMTHVTSYLKGQSEFNEGLAVMVGKYGALAFFCKHYGDSHPFSQEARKAIGDEIIFSFFLDRLMTRLEELYSSNLEYAEKLRQREEVFNQAMGEFHSTEDKFRTDQFKNFKRDKINNAYLMTAGLYHRHFNLFRETLKSKNHSVKDTVSWLKTIMENEAEPMLRINEWLEMENR